MAEWKFFKSYGKGEYICTDIGNILKIEVGEDHWLSQIITEESEIFMAGEKPFFSFCCGVKGILECKDQKGQYCSDPRVLYICDRNWEMVFGYHPLTEATDEYYGDVPDELMKARQRGDKKEIDRLEKYIDACPYKGKYPTQPEWERFCLDIPTREYALEWLKKREYQIEPVYFESETARKNIEKYYENYSCYTKHPALDFGN